MSLCAGNVNPSPAGATLTMEVGFMLSALREGDKLVGIKQSGKAVKEGRARQVYIASDAAPNVVNPIVDLCKQTGTEITYVPTMELLGSACGIKVGSAVAVLLK